ncbi:MAG: PRC-barrel domain-containing protein [Candidatus Pacearchaeota archaeon]
MNKKIIIFLLFVLLVKSSFAITASSPSYSVSSFGNGLSTGGDGDFTYLSEPRATSGNVQSSSLSANIGFFNTGSTLATVSIKSYSINPRTAVIGSTISLYVEALNSQSVWAKIISPNSQETILNLVNGQTLNYLPIPSIIGTYQVIFYANSSTGAIASVVDSFELTSVSISAPPGSTGGSSGGSSGFTVSCNYNWDCTPWSLCSEGLQNRVCTNIGDCQGIQGKPNEQITCSESLFDVLINLESLKIEQHLLTFDILLTETLNSDEIDVHVKYSIIDSNNFEVFSQIETRAVKDTLSYQKILEVLNLIDGNYKLRVDVLYGNLQRAFAEQSFELSTKSSGITGFAGEGINIGSNLNLYSAFLILGLIILIIIISRLIKRKPASLSDRVSEIIGLEVYTDSGAKLGKIYDVTIQDNKIYGLKIVVDSNVKIAYPKVMIRYEYVQNIKHVVIVSSRVLNSSTMQNG